MIERRDFAYSSTQPGIDTRHVFSAGAHYDPATVSYGPVIGCDEHTVAPGGGFERHGHRGVVIVSWVLAGLLRHEDDAGDALLVAPGDVLVQSCGDGIAHRETNGGPDPLRFVQTTLLVSAARSVTRHAAPVAMPVTLPGGTSFAVLDEVPPGDGMAVSLGDAVLVIDFGP